jgi:hypothetical protein
MRVSPAFHKEANRAFGTLLLLWLSGRTGIVFAFLVARLIGGFYAGDVVFSSVQFLVVA